MTGDKMRRIQSRVKKLSRLFPAKPTVTPKQVISGLALKRLLIINCNLSRTYYMTMMQFWMLSVVM